MLPSSQHLPNLSSDIQSDTTVQRIAPATATHHNGEHSNDETKAEPTHKEWSLPETPPIADPTFNRGSLDAQSFIRMIDKAYAEVVLWKLNLLTVPFGKLGKQFATKLARLYKTFAQSSALECISSKAATVLTTLARQKPYKTL